MGSGCIEWAIRREEETVLDGSMDLLMYILTLILSATWPFLKANMNDCGQLILRKHNF